MSASGGGDSIGVGRDAAAVAAGSFRAWWLAARPKTLTASIAPVAVAAGLAVAAGSFHALAAAAALVGALLIQVGTNLANDVLDFRRGADTAERLGPTRVVQAGLLSPRAVAWGAAAAFALAALVGLYLIAVGGLPILAIGLLAIASGVAYTAGPAPLAYVGLGDAFVMAFFGVAAVAGTYLVQARAALDGDDLARALALLPHAAALGVAVGALAVAILTINNLRDIPTDRAAGKRTLAVRLGEARTRRYLGAQLALAFAVPVALALLPVVPRASLGGVPQRLPMLLAELGGGPRSLPTLLAVLAAAPMAVRLWRDVAGASGRALNPLLARTARLQMLHAALLALALAVDPIVRAPLGGG